MIAAGFVAVSGLAQRDPEQDSPDHIRVMTMKTPHAESRSGVSQLLAALR
jgi:hypothetical protein